MLDSSDINDVSSHLDDDNREPTLPTSYGEGASMLEAFLEKVQPEPIESRNHENSLRKMMNTVDSLEVFSDPESGKSLNQDVRCVDHNSPQLPFFFPPPLFLQ